MPVHIYGHPVDMAPLLEIADRYGLAVVEDAAEAHGAEYRSADGGASTWRRCGSFGALSTFSFYANKLVSTGEGGMVLTDDEALANRLRLLRNLAFQPPRRFLHEELGFNFRLTNLQAALGVAQTERIDRTVARKRAIGQRYLRNLRDVAQVTLPVEREWARNVYWMFGVVLGDAVDRSATEVSAALRAAGVETRPFFVGMHRQPVLQRMGLVPDANAFPVTDRIGERGFYLPSGSGLTDNQIDFVSDSLRRVLE
jgi:perosamine synthetase